VAKPISISLTDTLIRTPRSAGLQLVQPRGAHGAGALSSWRLCLAPGTSATFCRDTEETVVVLQNGRASWCAAGESWTVTRTSVFGQRATALFLPPGVELTCTALPESQNPRTTESQMTECILISTPAPAGHAPVLLRPDQVEVHQRGRGHYSREVHDLFVRDPHARRLMVGETFNPPGHWSSFPPHKHDGLDGEPRLEEIYHYRVHPPQGFGHQMLYTSAGESVTHQVRDGDVVVLPYGYHPVSSPPGYHLYYLWAMVGDERRLALFEDPAHTWIHDAPDSLAAGEERALGPRVTEAARRGAGDPADKI
jgi:5-deoxy-glucuronate isomerase